MLGRRLRYGVLAALLVFAGSSLAAAEDMAAYRDLNDTLVTQHVVPRYAVLVEATAGLAGDTEAYCAAPAADKRAKLRASFHQAMDAWMGVQHLRFGPVEFLRRYDRFAFWPDKRNSGARHLTALLEARDPAALEAASFARSSIAVQGFTALERLLFGADEVSAFDCQVMAAIAGNLNRMAAGVVEAWRGGEPSYRKIIGAAGEDNPFYRDAKEATLEFFKAFHGALQMIADLKLARPLGESLAAAKPRRAESWRSGRSLENLAANLDALTALHAGPGGFSGFIARDDAGRALDQALRASLAKAAALTEAIDVPLFEAVDDAARRPKVERLLAEVRLLRSLVRDRLSAALGLQVGFNAFDGD